MTIAHLLLEKLKLYSSCSIPALLFYILTFKSPCHTPNAILSAIVLLNFAIPITHNGAHGDMIDHSVVGTLTCYLGFGMIGYIVDRHQGKPTVPFYRVLNAWNQRPSSQQQQQHSQDKEQAPLDTSTMQSNAFKWLMLAWFRVLLSMPVMAFLDGFLRVCNEPPLDPPYISLMLSGKSIPIPTLYYYAISSIALIMHLVLVPTIWLVIYSTKLCYLALFSPKTMASYHDKVADFVQRPPLFDQLWLASSVHDMWSRRWHQIFRSAFRDIAYLPIRRLFPSKPLLGRALGVMSVFALSGLMHDYILLCMVGYQQYVTDPGLMGIQSTFFLLQGMGTVISNYHSIPKIPRSIARLLTFLFLLYSAPFFMEPYIRIKLNLLARVPGYPQTLDPYLGPICPYGSRLDVMPR
ncbi:hypothetical protein K492DRAFT_239745 [Lichtheimia hyalospora FSU 10163]|nr:hypothetical protein K492DRAFT_239745 [Lichtheimia hyalospora FSU 10163]